MGAYPDAGPLRGNVPSSRIDFAVTPGVAEDVAPAVTTMTAETLSAAAISRNVFLIRSLSSVGVTWGVVYGRIIRVRERKEKDTFTGFPSPSPDRSGSGFRASPRPPR